MFLLFCVVSVQIRFFVHLKLSNRLTWSMQLYVCLWPEFVRVLIFWHWSSKCSWWCYYEAGYASFFLYLCANHANRSFTVPNYTFNWRHPDVCLFRVSIHIWLFGFMVRMPYEKSSECFGRIDPLCIIQWRHLLALTVQGMHRFGWKKPPGAQMGVALMYDMVSHDMAGEVPT